MCQHVRDQHNTAANAQMVSDRCDDMFDCGYVSVLLLITEVTEAARQD